MSFNKLVGSTDKPELHSKIDVSKNNANLNKSDELIKGTHNNEDIIPYVLISCVDYRFIDLLHTFMIKMGLLDKYFQITLPGASLGIENDLYPNWENCFFSQFDVIMS